MGCSLWDLVLTVVATITTVIRSFVVSIESCPLTFTFLVARHQLKLSSTASSSSIKRSSEAQTSPTGSELTLRRSRDGQKHETRPKRSLSEKTSDRKVISFYNCSILFENFLIYSIKLKNDQK